MTNEHTTQTCQLLSAKALGKMLRLNRVGCIPKPLSTSGTERFLGSDVSLFLQCGCDIAEFQAQEQYQFKDVQELLGTVLFALTWTDWADKDRATLLRCTDCLERKLIDIKRASNIENPAVGAEHPR